MRQIPKGHLLISGGAEDKGGDEVPEIQSKNRNYEPFELLKELLPSGNKQQNIEVITTATEHPEKTIKSYKKAFHEIGYKNVNYIVIVNNEDAHKKETVQRIKKAHAVFLSGGEQFRLSTILGNTPVLDALMKRYMDDADFVVGGTSAGAMGMAEIMIIEGGNDEAMLKGSVRISGGLGLINHIIIDTHFIKRGRFGRLAEAVIMNPTCTGLGLGEDKALIVRKGNIAECKGSGMVVIIDGQFIGHTNVFYAEEETPLCVENLRVHILSKGNKFMLRERKFVPAPQDLRKEQMAKLS